MKDFGMGRRSKNLSYPAANDARYPVKLLLPKSSDDAGTSAMTPFSFPVNGKFVITQIPIPMSVAQPTIQAVDGLLHNHGTKSRTPSLSPEKTLLPKLPPGVRPPSKIIFIQNESSDNPSVQIIDTSRARLGHSESDQKMKILTGECPCPSKILPRPTTYYVQRPAPVIVNTGSGPITKLPIPKITRGPSPKRRKLWSQFGGSKEDALDGFDDTADCVMDVNFSSLPISEYEIIQTSEEAGPQFRSQGRIILPRPPQPTTYYLPTAGSSIPIPIQISMRPDPESYRLPKRKRRTEPSSNPPTDFVWQPPAEPIPGQRKGKGRPSHLKKTTQQLLDELNRDCLALASDGRNLKCLACNCVLTKHGWGYARQINKHLLQIQSHRSRYDLWKHRVHLMPDLSSTSVPDEIPETRRCRGRYKKTALDYYNEYKNAWLYLSPDGQTLTCTACKLDLVVNNQKVVSGDLQRHLQRDETHLANVSSLNQENADYVPELSEIVDSVLDDADTEEYVDGHEESNQSSET